MKSDTLLIATLLCFLLKLCISLVMEIVHFIYCTPT